MNARSARRSETGQLVVIAGPSGSGKTTICKRLGRSPEVLLSVSATTRGIRDGEVDGRDYYFMSEEEFDRTIAEGGFLEHACYNTHRYGTLKAVVDAGIASGKTVVLEIEVQGTRILRDKEVAATYVFIMPPSLAELEHRLRGRRTEGEEEIGRRLAIAKEEIDMAHLYDRVIINDELGESVAEVRRALGLCSGGADV